jgi:putative spermidine/putrescine transport system ATP-binding protein
MSYLELEHISKRFGKLAAVRDFNLKVEKSEFVSLLGPSGCGKTTTLRIIAGFEEADSGTVRVDGEDVSAVPPNRRGMGMVFQSYALFPNMTAWDNVAFGLRVAGRPAQEIERRVGELLDLVGLGEAGHKFPHQLSGGQQQRVALGRALAIEPRVLLLDEPLSALDAVVRVNLRQEIRRIQTTLGITTVYVTHDQEEALSLSDRVVVMRKAEIEQVGAPQEIYAHPRSHFVATFVGTINELAGVVTDAREGRVVCNGWEFTVTPREGQSMLDGDAVIVLVRPEDVRVTTPDEPVTADNHLDAVVEGFTFLGSVTRVLFSAGGRLLVADTSTRESARFQRGDSARLSFAARACRVMRGETGPVGDG